MIRIGNNIQSLAAQSRLARAESDQNSARERLSSGARINHAADDPAGLAVSMTLRADARVYTQSIRNLGDGLSYLNVAGGALTELSGITVRLEELAAQAANGVYGTAQRAALDREARALGDEFNRIISVTSFNGIKLFGDGTGQVLDLQAGPAREFALRFTTGAGLRRTVGDGTFAAATDYSVGSLPVDVAVADFDRDGRTDAVVANFSSGTVSVLRGNGDGTFAAGRTVDVGGLTSSVAIVDMNGDGAADVVTSSQGAASVVILGNGDGTFRAPLTVLSSWAGSRNVEAGDVNGDGRPDLVTYGTVAVHLGRGDGTTDPPTSYGPTGGESGTLTDVNGDGMPDLMGTGLTFVHVRLGDGRGNFGPRADYAVGNSPQDVVAVDLNRDSYVDLVTPDDGSSTVSVLFGNGDGSFRSRVSYAASNGTNALQVVDVNGDGHSDIVTSDRFADESSVFLGRGDGTFADRTTFAISGGPEGIRAADLNGDSVVDLMFAAGSDNALAVRLGNTTTSVTLPDTSLLTRASALGALTVYRDARNRVSAEAGAVGAAMARVEKAMANVSNMRHNYTAADSRIMDADIAFESGRFVAAGIRMRQAASILAQANTAPAMALALIGR